MGAPGTPRSHRGHRRGLRRAEPWACVLWALCSIAATGCGGMREMGDLAQQLSERYKVPARVTINEGTHLGIPFQNGAFEGLPDEQRRALARDVARFSRSHYGD